MLGKSNPKINVLYCLSCTNHIFVTSLSSFCNTLYYSKKNVVQFIVSSKFWYQGYQRLRNRNNIRYISKKEKKRKTVLLIENRKDEVGYTIVSNDS